MIEEIKDDLSNFQEKSKVLDNKWTDFMIFEYDCLGDITYNFEVSPDDFLDFAKNSMEETSQKGLIDAMSNAKRAIECQIDSIILYLGYDYKNFDKRTAYANTKKFINKHFNEDTVDGITDRIKLLQIFNITPPFLISKIRSLRNKVEHEYIVPELSEVREAIEIAELFINSSMRKINFINRIFYFGSNYGEEIMTRRDGSTFTIDKIYPTYMCFEIDEINNRIVIKILIIRKNNDNNPYDYSENSNEVFIVNNESEVYPYILLMFFTKQYHYLLKILGIEINKEHIKYVLKHA